MLNILQVLGAQDSPPPTYPESAAYRRCTMYAGSPTFQRGNVSLLFSSSGISTGMSWEFLLLPAASGKVPSNYTLMVLFPHCKPPGPDTLLPLTLYPHL